MRIETTKREKKAKQKKNKASNTTEYKNVYD